MSGKLTGPQRALLIELSETPRYVNDTYPPVQKLLALGYVYVRESIYSDMYAATDLGRAALAKAHPGEEE